MTNCRVLVDHGGIHAGLLPSDVPVDAEGNEFYVVGATKRLNLVDYDNTDPQEGDLWRWAGSLWTHIGGVTYRLAMDPQYGSSSMSASSSISSSLPA